MIEKCIYDVYKRDERVIIPEFGAIIYSDYSDEADFNAYLNFDDGKVAGEMQKQMKLSEEEATATLEKFVDNISKQIDNGKTVLIEGIGYMSRDEDGSIVIQKTGTISEPVVEEKEETKVEKEETPTPAAMKEEEEKVEEPVEVNVEQEDEIQIEAEEEDLEEVESSEIEPEETEKRETTVAEEGTHYGSTFIHGEDIELESEGEGAEEFFEEEDRPVYHYDEPEKKNPARTILLIALPLLLVLAAGYYYFFHWNDQPDDRSEKSSLITTIPTPAKEDKVAKTEAQEDTMKAETQTKPETQTKAEEPSKGSTSTPASSTSEDSNNLASVKYEVAESKQNPGISSTGYGKSYSLILGSFRVESNADNYLKTLQSKGLKVIKFPGKYDYYHVGYENIGDKSEALRQLTVVRQENPTAWIINRELIRL